MSYHLSIIGTKDNPIYELTTGTFKQDNRGQHQFKQQDLAVIPFVINASIDLIEDLQWQNNTNYFKSFDQFQNMKLNCFITCGNIKLILLYEYPNNNSASNNNRDMTTFMMKNDESLKQFLVEVNELFVKHNLNPFYMTNDIITSDLFDLKVRNLAKKYL